MNGKLWSQVDQRGQSLEHPEDHPSDLTIVLIQLRAAADDRPVSWACRAENWIGLIPPPTWPMQPTKSRRLRRSSVQRLSDQIWF